ncbi:MAG: Unknown protein [uncultured Thiotrichaceae bacterium]|uniref:Uncharacterized protein n=1 Tax=uncultured Thiotrichaceae bacterium TaxID=298394 RepID=A0A6S6S1S7_9GAMM|nr:MAG: Unknown protein [uncultured Thiotrichaceae bacterium]
MLQSNTISSYAIHGVLAAICAGIVGGILLGGITYSKFGTTAFAYAAMAFSGISLIMGLVIIPMMLLRRVLSEPYYFITLILLGFFGTMLAVNLMMGNNLLSDTAWQQWIVVSYGITGTLCMLVAWIYLHYSQAKWFNA